MVPIQKRRGRPPGDLHQMAMRLYGFILLHMQNGRCWMKNTELASGIGRSLTQTKEYLSYLEKQGYVKVSTNKKKLGGWSNRRCISLGAK